MSNSIVPMASSAVARREGRVTGRTLLQISGATEVVLAQIEQEADIQIGKVEANAHVGKRAMTSLAIVSQHESQLCQLVPAATTRLQALGDMVALQIVEVVSDTGRRVNRCG